jgi:voltage-gated potassium channel
MANTSKKKRAGDRAEAFVYKLLKEGGRQSEMNEIAEYIISAIICVSVVLIVIESMDLGEGVRNLLSGMRVYFFAFFLIEYIVRLWIADMIMKDKKHPVKSRLRYMLTFRAVIDLLALMPFVFGSTIIDFRIFRVLRLLRITQLKSLRRYTDTLLRVIKLKGAQLLAAVFIVFVFMLASAVIIYDVEHEAQPEVYTNVLTSLWWSVATTTTIGYGDMYPVTSMGKLIASIVSIAGVFVMAVPIGILTSGFMEVSRRGAQKESGQKPPDSNKRQS